MPNPAGPAGGTGVALATWLVTINAYGRSLQAVAKVFEYLLDADVSAEFAARTFTIPAREDLAAGGIDYQTDNETVAAALNGFAREAPNLQDQAIALDLNSLAPVYYEASNTYLRQYFAGELTLDDALAGLRAQLDIVANA